MPAGKHRGQRRTIRCSSGVPRVRLPLVARRIGVRHESVAAGALRYRVAVPAKLSNAPSPFRNARRLGEFLTRDPFAVTLLEVGKDASPGRARQHARTERPASDPSKVDDGLVEDLGPRCPIAHPPRKTLQRPGDADEPTRLKVL